MGAQTRGSLSPALIPALGLALTKLALALAAGLAWGVLCRMGMDETGVVYWISNLASPWLVVAFAMGAMTRSLAWGGVLGACALVAAIVSYYDPTRSFGGDLLFGRGTVESWIVVALVTGTVLGAAGAAWRASRYQFFAVAILATPLAVEALAGLAIAYLPRVSDRAYFVAQLGLAVALPIILLRTTRDRALALAAAALLGVPVAMFYLAVRLLV